MTRSGRPFPRRARMVDRPLKCIYQVAAMKYQRRGEDLVLVSMKFPKRLWEGLKQRAARDDTTATAILAKLAKEHLAKKSARKRRVTDGLR